MAFNSLLFVVFFPIVCLLYYILPFKLRNSYLLLISFLFYAIWKPVYLVFLLWVILASFFTARIFERQRKISIWIGVTVVLLPLLFFKYYSFFNQVLRDMLPSVFSDISLPGLNWAIPIGISFYTFQALGYVFDVYRHQIKAEQNLLHHSLFISFFPQILSGPISRYADLMPQVKQVRRPVDTGLMAQGCKFMVWGMFLKVAVADRFGLFVDTVYGQPDAFTGLTVFFATLCYSIQIYTDFAGYSLLAIGCANILGFRIRDNFARPYFSFGFGEFWRRWHITLSTWLRDYVYIPMGGSRTSRWKIRRNLLVTFLISGLWHGAAYTYLLWGVLHGLFVIADRRVRQYKERCNRLVNAVGIVVTFILASLLWILFRVPTVREAFHLCSHMLSDHRFILQIPDNRDMKATVLTMAVMGSLVFAKDVRDEWFPALFKGRKWTVPAMIFTVVLILLFGVFDAGQFIYISF